MKKIIIAAAVALVSISANAQPKPAQPEAEYKFTVVKENPITSVKNQYRSSTCWCFSALGFLESEAIRIKNIKDTTLYPDFSEMFVVSHSYKDRAVKYVRTDGHINFAAGQSAMPGLQPLPIHGELDATTKAYVEAIAKNPNRTLSTNWKKGFDAIVDSFLGETPETFEYNGKNYTPASYRDEMGIVPSDYVTLTSFTHHPFYTSFIIEISDNWRWDSAYNIPLDEFMEVIYKGYTLAWGSDVSEKGFTRNGIGVLLDDVKATTGSDQERWIGKAGEKKEVVAELPKEASVTQESRQEGFENKTTTDDHGMQIFGVAKDQNGTNYFMVKNSWGTSSKYGGIWYCSDSFVRAKSMDVLVHKDALSKDLKKKLGIK